MTWMNTSKLKIGVEELKQQDRAVVALSLHTLSKILLNNKWLQFLLFCKARTIEK